ncbi:MAG: site-specific integrase [Bacteroidetes bacterium]|nr:site-specific integrase [Bacteroidota bacterium]
MQNRNIYPYIVKSKASKKDGTCPIYITIHIDNKQVAAFSTKKKIAPKDWDEQKRCVKSGTPNAILINAAIKKKIGELEAEFLKKELLEVHISKKEVRTQLKDGSRKSFADFCNKQIKEKYTNKETLRTYTSEVTKLELFRKDIAFKDIDFAFLQAYRAYMRNTLHNEPNTIWKSFKFMNTMMRDAIKMGGIIDRNPFDNFDRGSYKQTTRTFLTKVERGKLEELLQMDIPADLYKVVVYELFMCYAGLRFEDAMAFDYNEHIIDDERLIMETQKAKELVNIKLFPKLREVLIYVREHPLSTTNQEFNAMLKVAASMAGIEKKLTAHVGRHSFGRMLAENGVDIKKAQKLLGHRDERSTRIYFHLLDTDVDKEVDSKLASV